MLLLLRVRFIANTEYAFRFCRYCDYVRSFLLLLFYQIALLPDRTYAGAKQTTHAYHSTLCFVIKLLSRAVEAGHRKLWSLRIIPSLDTTPIMWLFLRGNTTL